MAKARWSLQEAQQEFLTMQTGTKSTKTLNNYQSTFAMFNDVFNGRDVFLNNVTVIHIAAFLNGYEQASTANVYRGQLNVFFKWCVRHKLLKDNPVDLTDARPEIKAGARVKARIPVEDWDTVLEVADAYHPLDRAVVAFGMYLGSRGSEIRNIKIGDLERADDGVIERVIVYRGKQKWKALIPVCPELADEIDRWLAWYEARHPNLPPDATLLPPRLSHRLNKDSTGRWAEGDRDLDVKPFHTMSAPAHQRILRRVLKRTGYHQKGEGTHTLRRSVAAALYEEDIDRGYSEALDTVRTFLGHVNTSTTEAYIGTSYSERKLEERLVRKHMFRRNAATTAPNVVPIKREVV